MIGLVIIAAVGWIAALVLGYHWYQGRLRIEEQDEAERTLRADLLEARTDVDDLMAAHASDVMRLERLLHEAEADLEQATGTLALAESLKADSDRELTKLHVRQPRTFALPTIDAGRLDILVAMEDMAADGETWRIDLTANDGAPMAAEALAAVPELAVVVPMKKRGAKR